MSAETGIETAVRSIEAGWSRGELEMALKMLSDDGKSVSDIAKELQKPEKEVCQVMGIENKKDALERLKELYENNRSLADIAMVLNREGYSTARGKQWTDKNVWNILYRNDLIEKSEPELDPAYEGSLDRIKDLDSQDMSKRDIAAVLSEEGYKTKTGAEWSEQNVRNVLNIQPEPEKKEPEAQSVAETPADPEPDTHEPEELTEELLNKLFLNIKQEIKEAEAMYNHYSTEVQKLGMQLNKLRTLKEAMEEYAGAKI